MFELMAVHGHPRLSILMPI